MSSSAAETDRVLAFAGILQALGMVQQTAQGERSDDNALQTSIASVLKLDADSTVDVYGSEQNVYHGLRLVETQLAKQNKKPDMELSRYLVTLLHLQGKLGKRTDLLAMIRQGVERARSQADLFPITHPNILASLAETYSTTISTLQPRLMIKGDEHLLRDPAVTNKIRALLLAAMRSAVLWRQLGGSRLGLLFSRHKLVRVAEQLLARISH